MPGTLPPFASPRGLSPGRAKLPFLWQASYRRRASTFINRLCTSRATRADLGIQMMKFPRRRFLHLATGAAALPALPRRVGAVLSDAAGAHHRSFSCWPGNRQHRAPRRTIAVGAAGTGISVIENRTGAGGNIGTEAAVRAPLGRVHARAERPVGRVQRDALPETQLRSHPESCAGRQHRRRPLCDDDQPVDFRQDGPGIHCLRQGQSRQAEYGVVGPWVRLPCLRPALQNNDRYRVGSRSEIAAGTLPICSADRRMSCSAP